VSQQFFLLKVLSLNPPKKFLYDHNIGYYRKKSDYVNNIYRSLKFLDLDVKYVLRYHTSTMSFKLNNVNFYTKVVCLLPAESSYIVLSKYVLLKAFECEVTDEF